MVALGVDADSFTYPSILHACGGRSPLAARLTSEFGGVDMVWTCMSGMLWLGCMSKCRELEDAQRVFDEMAVRGVVSWNTMVSGYASTGMCGKAFELLQWVPRANIVTWNAVAARNLKAGNYDEVIRLLTHMRSCHGPWLDHVSLLMASSCVVGVDISMLAGSWHGVAVYLFFDGFESVVNSLITMYSRCRMMSSAERLFRMCSTRSITAWNSLLAGFAFMDQVEEASLLLGEMICSSVCPNDVTVLTMLSLGARLGHLCHGRELHCYILKHGLLHSHAELSSYSTLDANTEGSSCPFYC